MKTEFRTKAGVLMPYTEQDFDIDTMSESCFFAFFVIELQSWMSETEIELCCPYCAGIEM